MCDPTLSKRFWTFNAFLGWPRSGGSSLLTLSNARARRYVRIMPLVRILVDGYSLLHNWPELAPGKARHSAAAREELIHILTRYRDAVGTPITIFFDGSGTQRGPSEIKSTPELEILFSRAGQTADDMIERAAHRFQPYGEVLAVTDDNAERETVIALGGSAASCFNFIRMVESALADLQHDIKHWNRRERNQFNRGR